MINILYLIELVNEFLLVSICNNGILEVIFNKKKQTKPKGKEIKVE